MPQYVFNAYCFSLSFVFVPKQNHRYGLIEIFTALMQRKKSLFIRHVYNGWQCKNCKRYQRGFNLKVLSVLWSHATHDEEDVMK